jgi:hypothetical protein
MSMKNSSDTIGNRSRDLSVCSTVSQSTAPPRAPHSRWELAVQFYPLLTSAQDGGGLSTTLSGRPTSGNDPKPTVHEAGLTTVFVHPVPSTCLIIDRDNIPALARMG